VGGSKYCSLAILLSLLAPGMAYAQTIVTHTEEEILDSRELSKDGFSANTLFLSRFLGSSTPRSNREGRRLIVIGPAIEGCNIGPFTMSLRADPVAMVGLTSSIPVIFEVGGAPNEFIHYSRFRSRSLTPPRAILSGDEIQRARTDCETRGSGAVAAYQIFRVSGSVRRASVIENGRFSHEENIFLADSVNYVSSVGFFSLLGRNLVEMFSCGGLSGCLGSSLLP